MYRKSEEVDDPHKLKVTTNKMKIFKKVTGSVFLLMDITTEPMSFVNFYNLNKI